MFSKALTQAALSEAFEIFISEFPLALWETLYVTIIATAFAIIIGLPLGVLLVTGDENGIAPIPKWIYRIIEVVINFLRSVPFIILIVLVLPLTRAIIGTTVGTVPSIVPLVIAAFPFIARLSESCLREVDPNLIEAAISMGATPWQIVTKVMIPEAVPSLILNATTAITTILGYTAMSGIIGGGGLGKLAIDYGYYRYKYLVMVFAVLLLVLIVQLFQTLGTKLAVKSDKRLK